jgi:hypothetical protein
MNFGLEPGEIVASIGENCSQTGVKFPRARFGGNLCDVGGVKTGSRHDGDAIAGGIYQLAQPGGPFRCAVGSPRGEKTCGTSLDDIFERSKKVGRVVKSAVKCDLKRPSCFDEFASAFHIDGVVFAQYTDSNAIKAKIASGSDGAEHSCELGVGVAKIAGARTNNCEHRNFQFVMDLAECCDRGRNATMRQL